MRKTLFISLFLVAAATVLAQGLAAWRKVAPPDEEFTVLMPTSEREVSRVLPFAEGLNLVRPVYEVSADGLHFMVVSFDKSEREGQPDILKTFDGFAKGFEHSVRQDRQKDGNTVESEEDFTLRGMKIRPYRVRMNGRKGVARLYEAPRHFYAVMILGATYGDARVDRFLKSFQVKTGNAEPQPPDDADDMSALMNVTPPLPVDQSPMPEEPWPIHRPTGVPGVPRAPIAGGVLNGKAISKPQPPFPPIAAAARAQGTVVLQITVDEEGRVISARALSGHPLLQQAAVQAARQARFTPTLLAGVPVKVVGTITYNFVLAPDPDEPPTRKY